MENRKLEIDELSYDGIKKQLKSFLRGQTRFKDFDFEGSNMNVLIELLAYNTYYNSLYDNFTLNEVFLDSASKRESAVSIVKLLSYTPKSFTCSTAIVDVTMKFDSTSNELLMQKGQTFTSMIDGKTFTFVTNEDNLVYRRPDGTFLFPNLKIYGGQLINQTFIVDPFSKFLISNKTVDLSTLKVVVYSNSTETVGSTFTLSDNVTSATENSEIYFLKENETGFYEIEFGNGKIGKLLEYGNLVRIEYIASSIEDSNGCASFTLSTSSNSTINSIKVKTKQKAIGWSEKETLEEIKFNAPRHHMTQNRGVNAFDFETLTKRYFSNCKSVIAWGGESNIPVAYNTVFVCVQPKTGTYLTADEKKVLVNEILKPKTFPSTKIQIVDSDFIFLKIYSNVYCDSNKSILTKSEIMSLVKQNILNFCANGQKFNTSLKYSQLVSSIDKSEKSIVNNITTIELFKIIAPKININGTYTIDFCNQLSKEESSIRTSGFYLQDSNVVYYIENDNNENLVLYYIQDSEKIVVNKHQGTVDFVKGIVKINGVNISSLNTNEFTVHAKPASFDIFGKNNTIIDVNADDVVVEVQNQKDSEKTTAIYQ